MQASEDKHSYSARNNIENLGLLRHVFWFALSLYLLVLPVAHTIAIRYVAFILLIGVTIFAAYKLRKLPVIPFVWYWISYLLVATVATVMAINPADSLSELKVEVIYCAIIFYIGFFWGTHQNSFVPVVLLLAAVNALMTGCAFYFTGLSMPFGDVKQIPSLAYAGLDGNWILLVVFMYAWAGFYFLSVKKYILACLMLVLVVLDCWAMLVTYNRQNFAALEVGVVIFGFFELRREYSLRRLLVFFTIFTLVAALFVFQLQRRSPTASEDQLDKPTQSTQLITQSMSSDVRWDLWRFSIEKIAENPLVGGGLGRSVFDKLYPDYRPEIGDLWHAHNMIINKGIQMGIPGIIVFCALWLALGRKLWWHLRQGGNATILVTAGLSGLFAIFTKNQTDDFFVRNIAIYFWLIMGLLIGYLSTTNSASSSDKSHLGL